MTYDYTDRLTRAFRSWRRWYDWPTPARILTGRGGDEQESPRGRDLWFVHVNDLESFQRSYLQGDADRYGFITTTNSKLVRRHPDVSWKIFDLQDDGRTLLIGYWPEPGSDGHIRPCSIQGPEIDLLWRWFWIDHKLKAQWLGLRPWIYWRALHASVHQKVPFTCQASPGRDSGGYDHWYCDQPKRHQGAHRYRNYSWADKSSVEYSPLETHR